MLIKAANAYIGGRFRKADILIKGERIAKIANTIEADGEEVLDAAGLVALPGLIEMHAHLREPGQTQKEDFITGSRAALAGGYTLVYDMPNNMPVPTITKAALEEKKQLAKKALCEIRFHFGATDANLGEVKAANPGSMKMYLGKTTGNIVLNEDDAILAHMRGFPKERQIVVHAHGEGGSEEDDEKGIARAVSLAKTAARKVHLTHLTTVRELEIAGGWRLASIDCTPHHLFLNKEDGAAMKPEEMALVNPPLRSRKEVALLWKNLDKIDAVATDHAPHLPDEKMQGARGFPGLETALALFFDAYSKKLVSLEWIAQRFSENPAKIMGLKGYGKLENGYFANITLVDTKKEWKVEGSELYTKCKWSPFEGRKLKGRVARTICKGKTAFTFD
ncbi:Allantoinase [uncultured archaeon]|nr:Allantoinase [uncultured archaeon]